MLGREDSTGLGNRQCRHVRFFSCVVPVPNILNNPCYKTGASVEHKRQYARLHDGLYDGGVCGSLAEKVVSLLCSRMWVVMQDGEVFAGWVEWPFAGDVVSGGFSRECCWSIQIVMGVLYHSDLLLNKTYV